MTSEALLEFPAGFVWGTATAAHQIEGGWDADGKGESIWDRFASDPASIADGTDARVACDHYHRFRDDLDLMASLRLHNYRFSLSRPRACIERSCASSAITGRARCS